MLPVDQRSHAVRGLAGGQQERVAALAHERIRAQHRAQGQRIARRPRPSRSAHDHAGHEPALSPRGPSWSSYTRIEHRVAREHPVAAHDVRHLVRRAVGLPGRARCVPRHRVVAERAGHHRAAMDVLVRLRRRRSALCSTGSCKTYESGQRKQVEGDHRWQIVPFAAKGACAIVHGNRRLRRRSPSY